MSCRVGAFGEQWTSAELRNLGRGWTILNNVRVPAANGEPREVDHIAVGPGGVLVLDSKFWPSREHQLDTSASPYIDGAAKGACQQAGVVRWFLSDCVPGEIVRPTASPRRGTTPFSRSEAVSNLSMGEILQRGCRMQLQW